MGKQAAKQAEQSARSQANIAGEMSGIARGLISESAPWRKSAGDYYSAIASGDRGTIARTMAPTLSQISNQFSAAQRRAEETMPRGGNLEATKRDLRLGEAASRAGATTGSLQEAVARLASMGWGGTQAGVGAFGGAGNQFGGAANTMAGLSQMKGQNAAQGAAGLGSMIAMI